PVISPLPLRAYRPAHTGEGSRSKPRGRIAVTPVRTGPWPVRRGPSPSMRVVMPTSTPGTSVMALYAPGRPGKSRPRSRARGLVMAELPAIASACRARAEPQAERRHHERKQDHQRGDGVDLRLDAAPEHAVDEHRQRGGIDAGDEIGDDEIVHGDDEREQGAADDPGQDERQ